MIEYQPRAVESASESLESPEKSSATKKKRKLGRSAARKVIVPPPEAAAPDKAQSLWQRFAAIAEKKEIDKQFLRPVEQADNDAKLAMPDVNKADAREVQPDEHDAPLETLSQEEKQETIKRYSAARKDELETETRQMPVQGADPRLAETAADTAFLAYVEAQLREDPELAVEELLAAAELAAREEITNAAGTAEKADDAGNPEAVVFLDGTDGTEEPVGSLGSEEPDGTERSQEPDGTERLEGPEGEIPLHNHNSGQSESDEQVDIPLTSGGGGNSGGGKTPPSPPPSPPPPGSSPPGGAAAGNPGSEPGNGNVPIPPRYDGGSTPMAGRSAPYAPLPLGAGYGYISPMQARKLFKDETFAYQWLATGNELLLGGIIGYLIGRRRGRIKTEKKLVPIQKKLEKEVTALHAMVFQKEQAIRGLAAQKAAAISNADERQRFTEQLMQAEVLRRQEVERQPAYKTPAIPNAERLGRVLVEAPFSPSPREAAANSPGNENSQEPLQIALDRRRKIETYTTAELKQAARKIQVEGVTLKQLWDAGRLDEPALRRVMVEFIEGRSIYAALNQELLEKELRIEKNPQLRGAIQAQKNNMAAIAGTALLSHQKQDTDSGDISRPQQDEPSSAKRPETSKKPADASKKKAMNVNREQAELAGGLVVLAVIVVLIIVLL